MLDAMSTKTIMLTVGFTSVMPILSVDSVAAVKPNIIFFMAEDVSTYSLELYMGYGAKTPVLNEMAGHGVIFENAYSCAPVSSAARSTIITGCYAPAFGLSSHRKLEPVSLPDEMWMFPHYLRSNGYFTSNANKTDYNCLLDKEAWDIIKGELSDWRKRNTKDQPFFHWFSINACHESCLHFPETDVDSVKTSYDPTKVNLLPYHPDTKLFRYTYARQFEKISYVDSVLGNMIEMLKVDKLLDDTFIFFIGDNGGCTPFSKGYTNEAGLHVPVIVYVPENWKEVVPYRKGSRAKGFIDFTDLAPTVLCLAGIRSPDYMTGKAFIGKTVRKREVEKRDEVYCYGDRFDELYAVNRTLRKGNIKYSRNFYPFQPKGLFCAYRYRQASFRQWRDMFYSGLLNDVQSGFFRPQGPEELYDLSIDPYETVNLVGNDEYSQVLSEMREKLGRKMIDEGDLALVTEAMWLNHVNEISIFKEKIQPLLPTYYNVFDLQTRPFEIVEEKLIKALKSSDAIVRYWAVTACCSFGKEAYGLKDLIENLLDDPCSVVRSRCIVYCGITEVPLRKNVYCDILSSAENEAAMLMILNDMAYLYDCLGICYNISKQDLKYKSKLGLERLEFINGKY